MSKNSGRWSEKISEKCIIVLNFIFILMEEIAETGKEKYSNNIYERWFNKSQRRGSVY